MRRCRYAAGSISRRSDSAECAGRGPRLGVSALPGRAGTVPTDSPGDEDLARRRRCGTTRIARRRSRSPPAPGRDRQVPPTNDRPTSSGHRRHRCCSSYGWCSGCHCPRQSHRRRQAARKLTRLSRRAEVVPQRHHHCLLLASVRPKGTSSIGRAPVSKTGGWGFESLVPCHNASPIDLRMVGSHTRRTFLEHDRAFPWR